MKKGLKIGGVIVGVIIILMLLLPFAFQGKIAGIVKTEGNKMLNAQFDFRKLSISLFRNFPQASLTLEDFWLKGTGDFEGDTLVQAGEVTAAVNLFSLFGDKGYDVSKVSLKDTRLHAIVLPDGRVNWDIVKPDTVQKEEEIAEEASAFKIKLKQFVADNVDLVYDDRQGNRYVEVLALDALCSGDLSSDRTTLKLKAETGSLTYKMNGIPFLSKVNLAAKMDIDADLANHKYTLKDNSFRLNAIEADLDGWMALKDPAIDMDLKMNTNDVGFKEILSLIPAIYATEFSSLKTDGTATLTASVKGIWQGDTVPAFDVDMQVKDAMFRYPSLPAGVDRINVNARIQNPGGSADLTTIRLNPFSFRMAGNPFTVIADIKTPVSDPDFRAEAKGILDLGMVKQVYPLQDMELNGTVNADMQMAGRMSYIEKEQYDRVQASGTVGLSGMKLKMKDMPDVDIRKSLLTFTPKYLQLSETTVNIGKNDLTADSRLENYMGYALKGTTLKGYLNVRSNHLSLNDFMKTDSVAAASADSTAATGIVEIPRNVDLQIDANLKQVLFNKMSFNDMNGKMVVKDGKVDMKNLSMNTMGGNVVMNGYYSTADVKRPQLNAAFKMNNIVFAQAYKDLDMVRQLAPVFEHLKGHFNGNLNVATDLDETMSPVMNTMQGNGHLSTRDINLSGIKVIDLIAEAIKQPNLKDMKAKDMDIDFTIKDGRVSTKPFDIKLGEYVLNLSGSTGIDQTIDYTGKVKLPASLAGDYAKLTTLDLKIGGSFDSPKVSVDTKSMANQAVQTVADEAIGRIGKKLGLDSAATANKDSLKQKVTEKATEKVFDFLKKKLK
ncbi:AsmA-like C-terminal region-containing protein [uncultured Bacteroides sp.]|uniref:AsmA family protein n=1 Tax=uncultured Bacteroides sp. TaxID=162156 RepID=UPI0027DB4382|nr:AsmA-like C-terminal region-containing protein [uncultured Bacteroides sp.]